MKERKQNYFPKRLRDSPLMRYSRGFAIFKSIQSPETLFALQSEASGSHESAVAEERATFTSDVEPKSLFLDTKIGAPLKRLICPGGIAQQSFYHHSQLIHFISSLAGTSVIPAGRSGIYAFYSRPGDFVGVHRDTGACDITLITLLRDSSDRGLKGGDFIVYPNRRGEWCQDIMRSPAIEAEIIPLKTGNSIVLLGGLVPHQILPVAAGQVRIVSALCFRVA